MKTIIQKPVMDSLSAVLDLSEVGVGGWGVDPPLVPLIPKFVSTSLKI